MSKPFLTIGCAVYDDFLGLWPTLQALRIGNRHALKRCEIVVVDNNPNGKQAASIKDVLGWIAGNSDLMPARYVPLESPTGTSAPRQKLFEEAQGDYVLCMDSHILFDQQRDGRVPEGTETIQRLIDFYEANPDTSDLYSGPMLYDNLESISTHWDDVWRSEMWGTWNTDQRGDINYPGYTGEPFEIPACGLGVFTCRKDAWLGFNPKFRGFGGEEFYIHTKFRKAGYRAMCLPWLRWAHRFGRPDGVPYPLTLWHKVRNYAIGHAELGIPFERMTRHFLLAQNEDGSQRMLDDGVTPAAKFNMQEWDAIFDDPSNPPETMPGLPQPGQPLVPHVAFPVPGQVNGKAPTGCCGIDPNVTLEQLYERSWKTASDCNEHMPKLRELAEKSKRVATFGGRPGITTMALLAAHPDELDCFDPVVEQTVGVLAERRGKTEFRHAKQRSEVTVLDKDYDLLYISTHHSAEQLYTELRLHAPRANRIALNGTQVYGEVGEHGGAGLLHALRRYMKEHPEWSVTYHTNNNNGFTVISRISEDKPELPSTIKMAWNYAKAKAAHVLHGSKMVSEEQGKARLDVCSLCPQRTEDRCTVCGCFLNEVPPGQPIAEGPGRAWWREAECPLGKWVEADAKFSLPVVEAKK